MLLLPVLLRVRSPLPVTASGERKQNADPEPGIGAYVSTFYFGSELRLGRRGQAEMGLARRVIPGAGPTLG